MEKINGTINGMANVGTLLKEPAKRKESTKPVAPAKNPPAQEFSNGRVVTRVWANLTHWGEISWQVDHFRKNNAAEHGRSFNLEPSDLQDAMRGLYQAQRWIKKTERRRRGRLMSW